MNGTDLLDTNIVAAILNDEVTIKQKLSVVSVALSSVVPGELYFGAEKSGKNQRISLE